MLFKPEHIDLIVMGNKTQTRRVCRPGERSNHELGSFASQHLSRAVEDGHISSVLTAMGRVKWEVLHTYAVQPGRGKPGIWWLECSMPKWELPGTTREAAGTPYTVGNEFSKRIGWKPLRIRITDIRQERLQDIDADDLQAEGISVDASIFDDPCDVLDAVIDARQEYAKLWDSINTRAGQRWADNPLVWALTFEPVE